MEEQIRAMKARLADIEKLTKNDHLEKLEKHVEELETQLEDNLRANIRSETAHERSDRKIRELSFQNIEDRKDYGYLESVVNQLSNVVNGYQSRVQMVQAVADENLRMYQETERRLQAARERAALAEEQLKKMREQ